MICPKCNAEMETMEYLTIELDRCTKCQGIWFDALEREAMQEIPRSEKRIDTGDPKVGRAHDAIRPTECPRCRGTLVTTADARQRHICYESCTSCGGAFLDAGEFTDLKHYDWKDWVRDLLTRRRGDS